MAVQTYFEDWISNISPKLSSSVQKSQYAKPGDSVFSHDISISQNIFHNQVDLDKSHSIFNLQNDWTKSNKTQSNAFKKFFE